MIVIRNCSTWSERVWAGTCGVMPTEPCPHSSHDTLAIAIRASIRPRARSGVRERTGRATGPGAEEGEGPWCACRAFREHGDLRRRRAARADPTISTSPDEGRSEEHTSELQSRFD